MTFADRETLAFIKNTGSSETKRKTTVTCKNWLRQRFYHFSIKKSMKTCEFYWIVLQKHNLTFTWFHKIYLKRQVFLLIL